ncbi:MAG: sporulation protein YqfD [Oscillospiraceae bacterium]|jgi:sporulation protein YqfD|nr:sporulation protein YqfD [Oscillospiraceae bacterium]
MANLGFYDFTAEGLSLERLLSQCAEKGIRLQRVRKVSARAVTGRVAAADANALRELAEARGWKLTLTQAHGVIRIGHLARRRAVLAAGIAAFLFLCAGAMHCIWFIEVQGAGPYTGEVQRILREQDVRVGRLGFFVDTDQLQETMARELTGLAWVGVDMDGVRLKVQCVQAQLAEDGESGTGDLLAARDGVIASITVVAGTPLVKAGDVVRAGQTLVRGQERGWGGAVHAVRAEASVSARVWYTAEAYVSALYTESIPTGEVFIQKTLCTPFFTYQMNEPPDYPVFDIERTAHPIGGALPIWLEMARYEAVERVPRTRPEEEVREEAALAATRLAQEKLGFGVDIVDKWVDYSMINGEGCRATAVIETIEEIVAASHAVQSAAATYGH